jgi:hypothetical protein
MRTSLRSLIVGSVALGAIACTDATQPSGAPRATLTLTRSAASALSAALLNGTNDSGPGHVGLIRLTNVDSVVVNITGVALRPRRHDHDSLFPEREDSLEQPDEPGGRMGPFGPGNPPPGRHGRGEGGTGGHGEMPDGMHSDSLPRWILLEVVSGGHVNLLDLPVEGEAGIVVAAGDVPAGDYLGVRLQISEGFIYLKTDVVTPNGDTLVAGTAIPVRFHRNGIMIKAEVTVPEGGGEFPIVFDAETTIGAAVVTPSGEVIIAPVMRHRLRHGA